MKRILILFLGLGFMACLVGEAVATVGETVATIIVHPEYKYSTQQKANLLQEAKAEAGRRNFNNLARETTPPYLAGNISFIPPTDYVSVFRVVDEWNCILSVICFSRGANSSRPNRIFIWLEDYPTADLFTDDVVWVFGKFRIIDGEHVEGMPGMAAEPSYPDRPGFGDIENLREMKIRVVRLMSPDELKNPTVYEAREAKERVKAAELAGDESAKDKALRRPWTINGNREWATFDGVKGGQVSLRFSRIHPTKRVVEETVTMYPMAAFSKEDKAWLNEITK